MTRSSILRLSILALVGLASACHAQSIFCRTTTWFNPTGASTAPFSNVAAAACATPSNATLSLNAGFYNEVLTLNRPMLITATSSPAQVGKLPAESTSLKVMSYNTHLFGAWPLPVWQDENRAIAMGVYFNQLRAQGLDLVGLQEVWSPDRWGNIWGLSLFPGRAYGGRIDSGNTQNSGLAVLSQHPISNFAQLSYSNDNGNDASASKGFLQMTITKGSFQIGFFTTHTQSGSDSNDVSDRALQAQQLASAVQIYRSLNPSHAVIVTGDFNMASSSTEFSVTMSNQFGGVAALADLSTNLSCLGDQETCTTCDDNTVRQAFNGSGNSRIDYILYANSADGSVRVIPKVYDVRRPSSPSLISGDGWNPETFSWFSLSSHILSDHEALYAEFELVRN